MCIFIEITYWTTIPLLWSFYLQLTFYFVLDLSTTLLLLYLLSLLVNLLVKYTVLSIVNLYQGFTCFIEMKILYYLYKYSHTSLIIGCWSLPLWRYSFSWRLLVCHLNVFNYIYKLKILPFTKSELLVFEYIETFDSIFILFVEYLQYMIIYLI